MSRTRAALLTHRRTCFNGSGPVLLLFLALAAFNLTPNYIPTLTQVEATLTEGNMYTFDSWRYLGKFCFDEAGGVVRFSFVEDARMPGTQYVSFYADQEDSWYRVYGNDKLTCLEKRNVAKAKFPLSDLKLFNNSYQYPVGGIIPRWWFVAVDNCQGGINGAEGPIMISYYRLHFTNLSGIFSYEFSKNIQGILQMSIFFLCLYWILMFGLAWIKQHAKQKNLQYTVVKFVFASVLIEWIGLLFNVAHYAKFAHDGKGVSGLQEAYYFFDFTANLILLYVVLNISKGWAVSTNYIPNKGVTYVVIGLLFLLYIALYIWVQEAMDPASVVYIYDTQFGWTVVAIRFALVLWVIYCVGVTWKLETEMPKRQFYVVWCLLAVAWLVSLPIIVIIGHFLETWKRERVVFALNSSVQAIMFLTITYIFRPFRSNRYVDILKPDETRAFGNNQMQIFPYVTTYAHMLRTHISRARGLINNAFSGMLAVNLAM